MNWLINPLELMFNIIKAIYRKEKIDPEVNTSLNLNLSKWLSYDKSNLSTLKKIFPFIFYLKPLNYYYILWLNISLKSKVPFLNKITKEEIKENELSKKIQYVLDWSDREFFLHKNLLEKLILTNEKYWKEKLGLK